MMENSSEVIDLTNTIVLLACFFVQEHLFDGMQELAYLCYVHKTLVSTIYWSNDNGFCLYLTMIV